MAVHPNRVFVGSTYIDLADHRQKVRDLLVAFDCLPVMMEDFEAMDLNAVRGALNKVDNCKIYVGAYAHRYGFCPPGSDISVTEMEFDRASQKPLTRLCYLVDETFDWPKDHIEDEPGKSRLQKFKTKIDSTVLRAKFTTPDSLAVEVAKSLHPILPRRSVQNCRPPYTRYIPTYTRRSHRLFGCNHLFERNSRCICRTAFS
jgi:hypothetical protein